MTQRVELREQVMDFLLETELVAEVSKTPILTSKGMHVLNELEKSARDTSASNSRVSSSFDGSGLSEGATEL